MEKIKEAKISKKNVLKAADLMAKLIGKHLGVTLIKPPVEKFAIDKYEADGRKGIGVRYYVGAKNIFAIRIGFLETKSKFSGKTSAELNDFSIWKSEEKFFEDPEDVLSLPSYMNVNQNIDLIFDFIDGKKIKESLENEDFEDEETFKENGPYVAKKVKNYWAYKTNGEPLPEGKGNAAIITILKKRGLWDEAEYKSGQFGGPRKDTKSTVKEEGEKLNEEMGKVPDDWWSDPIGVFEDIEIMTKALAKGAIKAFILAGDPGVGKTYHVTKVLKEMFGPAGGPNPKWIHKKGLKASPFGVYSILYQYRNDTVIVFDDSDSVLANPDVVNMFKAALDTSEGDEGRVINWNSQLTINLELLSEEDRLEYIKRLDDAFKDPSQISKIGKNNLKLPSSFVFNSRVIFISNLPKEKFDSAIVSRAVFINVKLSKDGKKERIMYIIKHMSDYQDLTKDEIENVMQKVLEVSKSDLTVRSMVNALNVYIATKDDPSLSKGFERLLKYF